MTREEAEHIIERINKYAADYHGHDGFYNAAAVKGIIMESIDKPTDCGTQRNDEPVWRHMQHILLENLTQLDGIYHDTGEIIKGQGRIEKLLASLKWLPAIAISIIAIEFILIFSL